MVGDCLVLIFVNGMVVGRLLGLVCLDGFWVCFVIGVWCVVMFGWLVVVVLVVLCKLGLC